MPTLAAGRYSWFPYQRPDARVKFSTAGIEDDEYDERVALRRLDGIDGPDTDAVCLPETDLSCLEMPFAKLLSYFALDLIFESAVAQWADYLTAQLKNSNTERPTSVSCYNRLVTCCSSVSFRKETSNAKTDGESTKTDSQILSVVKNVTGLKKNCDSETALRKSVKGGDYDEYVEDDITRKHWKDHWRRHMPSLYRFILHVFAVRECCPHSEDAFSSSQHQKDSDSRSTFQAGSSRIERLESTESSQSEFSTWYLNFEVCLKYILHKIYFMHFFFCCMLFVTRYQSIWNSIAVNYVYNSILKYISFLIISLGFWNEAAVRSFEIEERFKQFSLEVDDDDAGTGLNPRYAFAYTLSAIIGPRALLYLVFPSFSGTFPYHYSEKIVSPSK